VQTWTRSARSGRKAGHLLFAEHTPRRDVDVGRSSFSCVFFRTGSRLLSYARVLMVGRVAIVLGKQVGAPVALEVAPDAVDVVSVVLGIVELNCPEGKPLNTSASTN
jgi:hypothetical protein